MTERPSLNATPKEIVLSLMKFEGEEMRCVKRSTGEEVQKNIVVQKQFATKLFHFNRSRVIEIQRIT